MSELIPEADWPEYVQGQMDLLSRPEQERYWDAPEDGERLAAAPLRKPARVSRPARVTQHGTSRSYPHADHRTMALLRSRWAGEKREV